MPLIIACCSQVVMRQTGLPVSLLQETSKVGGSTIVVSLSHYLECHGQVAITGSLTQCRYTVHFIMYVHIIMYT